LDWEDEDYDDDIDERFDEGSYEEPTEGDSAPVEPIGWSYEEWMDGGACLYLFDADLQPTYTVSLSRLSGSAIEFTIILSRTGAEESVTDESLRQGPLRLLRGPPPFCGQAGARVRPRMGERRVRTQYRRRLPGWGPRFPVSANSSALVWSPRG